MSVLMNLADIRVLCCATRRNGSHAAVRLQPQVFVRESSMVPIYSVLLFGGELTVLHDRGLLKVECRFVCSFVLLILSLAQSESACCTTAAC